MSNAINLGSNVALSSVSLCNSIESGKATSSDLGFSFNKKDYHISKKAALELGIKTGSDITEGIINIKNDANISANRVDFDIEIQDYEEIYGRL